MFKEPVFKSIKVNESKQDKILAEFTPEQQIEIEKKRKILSSLAFFIGKDFQIPVELNEPGKGWYWNFKDNIIRIDPKDLLEKSIDELRYLICHEGGHRRILRTDFIPSEIWNQPGFSFMMNAIEDPRDDNFVAECYPKFREQMKSVYAHHLELEEKTKEKAAQKLGYQPRFMQAGFEYIKQWFMETQEQEMQMSVDLPDEVKAVVQATIESAQDSWWRYPSKQEADSSEELIRQYAENSYKINLNKIWPEFKKLVEQDQADQEMQEILKDMQKGESDGESSDDKDNIPQDLKDNLSEEEQKELEQAIEKVLENAKKSEGQEDKDEDKKVEEQIEGQNADESEVQLTSGEISNDKPESSTPIDLSLLSEELKQKIKDHINNLPEDQKKELARRAVKAIKDFEDEVNKELKGKLNEYPSEHKNSEENDNKDADNSNQSENTNEEQIQSAGEPIRSGQLKKEPVDLEGLKVYKERLVREINKNANIYEEYRREVLLIIDKLENDLREIFVVRRTNKWKSGFKIGKKIDIKKRIQEKAKGVLVIESRAWQKRELPKEKDYAISILVDLSGSMRKNNKSIEAFKAIIILAEVLNRLGIKVEILGFNDELYEYQKFGEEISKQSREHMGGMLKEVEDSCCNACGNEHNETDLGWATKIASERLSRQTEENKFLITITDGKLESSSEHPKADYDLNEIIKDIVSEQKSRLIGLGIGQGTERVSEYYPNSVANILASEMGKKLADIIREVIENYDQF